MCAVFSASLSVVLPFCFVFHPSLLLLCCFALHLPAGLPHLRIHPMRSIRTSLFDHPEDSFLGVARVQSEPVLLFCNSQNRRLRLDEPARPALHADNNLWWRVVVSERSLCLSPRPATVLRHLPTLPYRYPFLLYHFQLLFCFKWASA